MWSCCATLHVLHVWVDCVHPSPSVCWTFFSRQPKPVLTLRKKSPVVRAWGMLSFSNCFSSNGFWSHVDDDDEAVCRLACDPDEFVCRFPRDCLSNLQPVSGSTTKSYSSFALKVVSFSLSYLLSARNVFVFLLGSCQVLVMQSFAFSFRLSKVGSLIEWLLSSSICIYRENPMLRILHSLSSCSGVDVLLHGDSSYNIMWCSFHPMADSDFLYSSSAYHRESIVGWRPCFSCGGLFLHLSRLVVHLMSFGKSVLHSTTAVFIDHSSRDWGDVTVVLVELCWTPRRLQISSTAAMDYSCFPVEIAVRTLLFGRIYGKVQRSRCCSSRRSIPAQDDLASCLCGSCGPHCEFDFSTARGILGVKRTFWWSSSWVFHTYRLLNASCRQCIKENDCMWPCRVKLQVFLLSQLQIAPKYCMLKVFPSILLWRDPWFRKIAWSFLHAMYVFHRVHCSEEDRSISYCGIQFSRSSSFILHSSMMSLLWIAPSLPRRTDWSCRSNRVMAFDTS